MKIYTNIYTNIYKNIYKNIYTIYIILRIISYPNREMKNLCLIALLPALTCAFFLPIPPLFKNELSVSSHASHASHTSHVDATDTNTTTTNTNIATGPEIKEICTIVHFAETKLCNNKSSETNTIPPQLCSLLSLMNQTFCQDEKGEKGEKGEKHVNANRNTESHISDKNENIIEKFYSNIYIEEIKNNTTNFNPKDLCPVFDLVDKTFCTSANNKLNPKDLCPLLEFVEKELCT